MMLFPITQLMDEQKCYDHLLEILHPHGLKCPGCHASLDTVKVHRKDRAPLLYYRCSCNRVFNAFTGTIWQGTHCPCSTVIRILQGVAQGVSTSHLAKELEIDYSCLLQRRHKLQQNVADAPSAGPLLDPVVEADEMFQNTGEKGVLHADEQDPPRVRANKVQGHGTWEKDRPPVLGIVGRESGQIRLSVLHNTAWQDLNPLLMQATMPGTTVNTDDWAGYLPLSVNERIHVTVCHSKKHPVWARDLDGDGIREVHNNTMEGTWTGLRNFLRPFRGVNKVYLQQYVVMHEWAHNLKRVTLEFLRILCGVTQFPI